MSKADRRARKRANRDRAAADARIFVGALAELDRAGLIRIVRVGPRPADRVVELTDPATGEVLDVVPFDWLCRNVPELAES